MLDGDQRSFGMARSALAVGAVAACIYLPLQTHPDEHYSVQSVWHNRRLPFGAVAACMYLPLRLHRD